VFHADEIVAQTACFIGCGAEQGRTAAANVFFGKLRLLEHGHNPSHLAEDIFSYKYNKRYAWMDVAFF
jgi:hypothetical protein